MNESRKACSNVQMNLFDPTVFTILTNGVLKIHLSMYCICVSVGKKKSAWHWSTNMNSQITHHDEYKNPGIYLQIIIGYYFPMMIAFLRDRLQKVFHVNGGKTHTNLQRNSCMSISPQELKYHKKTHICWKSIQTKPTQGKLQVLLWILCT
mmetsp:Transcript_24599/g.36103  ORF Transcript_24599/g.36103 Transcript_24599/m.36103 type:complete len:151 (+) Transcript_24599:243-695(+)